MSLTLSRLPWLTLSRTSAPVSGALIWHLTACTQVQRVRLSSVTHSSKQSRSCSPSLRRGVAGNALCHPRTPGPVRPKSAEMELAVNERDDMGRARGEHVAFEEVACNKSRRVVIASGPTTVHCSRVTRRITFDRLLTRSLSSTVFLHNCSYCAPITNDHKGLAA